MMEHFELPLHSPVLVLTFILLVVFLMPSLFNKLRIPGIVGLILAGVLAGPNGFNILARDRSMELLGFVGLIYIMFLAGLEVNIFEFRKNRLRSLGFGALTFFIPFIMTTLVSHWFIGYPMPKALLLASIFASHTLLVYPIVSKMGLAKTEPITITVGGTLITDIAALLVLALVIDFERADESTNVITLLKLGAGLVFLGIMTMWVFPKIARWFFRGVYSEGGSRFLFTLLIIFFSASIAELVGVEPIIGALLAGLALNPLIPDASTLKSRLDFTGNYIFIPFFLLSTGMLAKPQEFFSSWETMYITLTFTVIGISSKFLAAYVFQKLMGYTSAARNVMFSLSNARAAAALAVVMIGIKIELFGNVILNATIFFIVFSSLVSSFLAEYSSRKMAAERDQEEVSKKEVLQRIMVPIGNPDSIEDLLDVAQLIKEKRNKEPIYALTVVADQNRQNLGIVQARNMIEKALHGAFDVEHGIEVVSRIDLNVPGGIQRSANELMVTELVIGWNARITARDKLFGTVLDNLLHHFEQMVLVCKIDNPLNTMNRLVIAMPRFADHEPGFMHWLGTVNRLAGQLDCSMKFILHPESSNILAAANEKLEYSGKIAYETYQSWEEFLELCMDIEQNDLFVLLHPRPYSVSHLREYNQMPHFLSRDFKDNSFIIIYPEIVSE